MECKSCSYSQPTDFKFCPECGGKVIHNRLTLKNLFEDIFQRFFDIDNTFLRTFRHLFAKPDLVIDSYVQGVRKRYINPLAYFGIALTLSGLMLFVMKRFYMDQLDYDVYDQGVNTEVMDEVMNVLFDLNTLLFVIYVPIFAIAGWLTFNKKNYNLTEFSVFAIYVLAHWSILSFPFSIGTLVLAPEYYLVLGYPFLVLLIGFAIFAMQRLNRFSTGQMILRTTLFTALVLVGYIGFIMVIYAILFLTGVISISDFVPAQ